MKTMLCAVMLLTLSAFALTACESAPRSEARQAQLVDRADAAIRTFKRADPTIEHFFEKSYAYAVFPSVTRGAIGVGGAHGHGVAYQNGRPVGYCEVTQGTVGAQLGGQSYSQIIFFETRDAFENFKSGTYALAANASAVAASHGAAAAADYERGVAVFTMTRGGLMFEAAVGGQRFTYQPM